MAALKRDSSPQLRDSPELKPENAAEPSNNSAVKNRGKSASALTGGRGSTFKRAKSTTRMRRGSPTKDANQVNNKNVAHMPQYQGVLNLNDPTSVRMQSSFLIKNQQSANFESYLAMMKKRKMQIMN